MSCLRCDRHAGDAMAKAKSFGLKAKSKAEAYTCNTSCSYPSSGRSLSSVRQVSLSGCFVILSLPHAYMNDLDIYLDRNTPWVDMSACVKFGLDRPSRLAGHTEHRYRQTNKHNAFLPARRYASAGLCDSDVSVRLSVRLSVRPSATRRYCA